MRTFAKQPKADQQTPSAKSSKPNQSFVGQSNDVRSNLHLHRTTNNQAAPGLPQADAEASESSPTTPALNRFAPNFSRVPLPAEAHTPIQPNLTISTPEDIHEQEADRMADQVMRMPVAPEDEADPPRDNRQPPVGLQLNRRASQSTGPTVPSAVAADIHSQRARGEALTATERAFFEPRFGVDFSRVRIHPGQSAGRLARALNADAFTIGNDIFLGRGGRGDKRLLAHELTHVAQRTDGHTVSRRRTEVQNQEFQPPEDVRIDALRSLGMMIEAADVAQMVLYQMSDPVYGGRWGQLSLTFGTGQQIAIDIRGHRRLAMRVGNTGAPSPILTIDPDMQDPTLRVMPSGELEVEGIPLRVDVHSLTTGPTITRFRLVGGQWQRSVTDFSTRQARQDRVAEGARQLRANQAGGLDLIMRAFRERLSHDMLGPFGGAEPRGDDRQSHLANELGEVLGGVVADLFANPADAVGLQTDFVNRLHGTDSPITAQAARRSVLNGYIRFLLQRSHSTPAMAIQLLPALGRQLQQLGADARLDHAGQVQLRQLAEAQLQAGNRAAALALFQFGAGTATAGETRLLSGRIQGDQFVTQTATGTLPLELEMDGVRRRFEGLPAADFEVAQMRADQIAFSNRWQNRARALNIFTDAELAAVPPTPEMMQRYFTARYNGGMPGQFAAMRAELAEYMEVAFLHTVLNVPDALEVWNSQQLPVSADHRWAGDCGVMTRAVLHMLSSISGLRFVPVASIGHVRMLVLNSAGSEGLLESNQHVHALAPGRNLEQRVRATIARHSDLQVLRNMPTPISLGAPVVTAQGVDIDQLYNASLSGAETALPGIDPALYAVNQQLMPIIHRFDDYESRRSELFSDWENYTEVSTSAQQAMQRRRTTLAPQQQQLAQDLAVIHTTHRPMQRFLQRLHRLIDYGADFLHGRAATPPHIITVSAPAPSTPTPPPTSP